MLRLPVSYLRLKAEHLTSHQFVPTTTQRPLKSHGRGHQDVQLAGLNALQGADIQVRLLRQALLGQAGRNTLPANIGAETL